MIAGNVELDFPMPLSLPYTSSLLKLPKELSDHGMQIRRKVHVSYLSTARNIRRKVTKQK